MWEAVEDCPTCCAAATPPRDDASKIATVDLTQI
jgi:hypothetical protein